MKKNRGLYIHIPFCTHLCSYCDFSKLLYDKDLVKRYLDELNLELQERKIKDITSIYIGGGTPTSLDEEELEYLLKMIDEFFIEGISYTIEANVENLTPNKIKILKKHGINRISVGVQTFDDNLLKLINRFHSYNDTKRVINEIVDNGINDINIDLIYGLPLEDMNLLKKDLDIAMTLPLTHISTYSLMINKNTKMYIDGWKEKDEDEIRKMYDYIVSYLKEHGFNRYEVSNFSKDGYESKHNLIYWHNEEYYGVGLGASGYIDGIRYTNTKSINKYLNHMRNYESEILKEDDICFYDVMLGLRLKEGILENKIINKEKMNELIRRNLLVRCENRIRVNDEYLFILDYILKELL